MKGPIEWKRDLKTRVVIFKKWLMRKIGELWSDWWKGGKREVLVLLYFRCKYGGFRRRRVESVIEQSRIDKVERFVIV